MNYLIVQYSYLQVLDFLTTIAFLVNGVREGNPLVRFAMICAPDPFSGLLIAKGLAIALGIYCWKIGRHGLLARINLFFAALVAWNLLALIVGTVA